MLTQYLMTARRLIETGAYRMAIVELGYALRLAAGCPVEYKAILSAIGSCTIAARARGQ